VAAPVLRRFEFSVVSCSLLSLVQFRAKCNQFMVVITARKFYRNPFSMLARHIGTTRPTTGQRDNETVKT